MLFCRRDQRCLRLLSLNRNASTGQLQFRSEEVCIGFQDFQDSEVHLADEPDRAPLRLRRSQDGISMKWTTFIALGAEQLMDLIVVPTEFSLGDNRGMKKA